MRKILSIIVLAVMLLAGCATQIPDTTPQDSTPQDSTPQDSTPQAEPAKETTPSPETPEAPSDVAETTEATPVLIGADSGRVIFTIADAAANMSTVSSIAITVDNISVHRTAGAWIDVSSEPRSFDLLQLNAVGTKALLAEKGLEQGIYYEVRLGISKVTVTDTNGTHDAKLPSGVLKFVGRLAVNINETSTVEFDFAAKESLHMTGSGEYILAPVVSLVMTHGSEADITSDGVNVKAGKTDTDIKVGMDENGFVGAGIKIRANARLTIENGKIKEN